MTNLDDALKRVTRLGLDTSSFIYFVETHPQYDALVTEIFQRIALGHTLSGVTSVITLCEVLVHPLRRGNAYLQREYTDLLLNSANLQTLPVDADVAAQAAVLRAAYNLRTPDALHLATALNAGCEAFLTNDSTLRRITEISVLTLDDLKFTAPSSTSSP